MTPQEPQEPQPDVDASASAEADPLPSVPEDEFGGRLAVLRESKGLKHDSLSELTKLIDPQKRGIARTTLRGYELGINKPGIRELRILSHALGATPNELIFGSNDARIAAYDGEPTQTGVVFGMQRSSVVAWASFAVELFNLDDRSRESVFAVTTSLAESKLGSVEYQRLMGAARELVDTVMDAYLDLPEGTHLTPEIATKLQPIVDAIFKKFNFTPPARAPAKAPPE